MKGEILYSIITATLLSLIFASCGKKEKQYYYSIDGGELSPIEEFSDSAAYMSVFSFFQSFKRDERELDSISKGNIFYIQREVPYFDLYNDKKEKITNIVNFQNKDSLENDAIQKAERKPSVVKQTVKKYEENKRKRKW